MNQKARQREKQTNKKGREQTNKQTATTAIKTLILWIMKGTHANVTIQARKSMVNNRYLRMMSITVRPILKPNKSHKVYEWMSFDSFDLSKGNCHLSLVWIFG